MDRQIKPEKVNLWNRQVSDKHFSSAIKALIKCNEVVFSTAFGIFEICCSFFGNYIYE